MSRDTIGFVRGSVRGRQKNKRNVRRHIRLLPSHLKLTKWDKLFRKRRFQNAAAAANSDK